MRIRAISSIIAISMAAAGIAAAQTTTLRQRAMAPYRVGFENMRAEAWDQAAKSFQAAIDMDATFEMAHYMLGRVRMAQKLFAEAVPSFGKARDLYVVAAGRQFSNAQDAQRIRRDEILEIDEAIRSLQAGPQTNQVLDQLRQFNERKRSLQDRIQRGNNFAINTTIPAFVSLSLGSAYFRSGNLPEAEKAYKEAIAADTKSGEAHNNLAVVYMETGRLSEAESEIAAAEKVGFRVQQQLKDEIRNRRKVGSN